jgi:hypothetical protein
MCSVIYVNLEIIYVFFFLNLWTLRLIINYLGIRPGRLKKLTKISITKSGNCRHRYTAYFLMVRSRCIRTRFTFNHTVLFQNKLVNRTEHDLSRRTRLLTTSVYIALVHGDQTLKTKKHDTFTNEV